jgi:tyrosine-specific transport protein
MRQETKKLLQATSVLMGTIIGVGTFGIPYAFSRSGIAIGMAYLAVLTLVILLMHLSYGEIALRTSEKHRLVGYAEKYLGKAGKAFATVMILSISCTLFAYLLVGGDFLHLLLGRVANLPATAWSMLFFAAMAVFVLADFKAGAPAEFAMNVVLLSLFVVIILRTIPDISFSSMPLANYTNIFLPYGVTLFALSGSAAIPELRDVLGGDSKIRRVIIVGTLIPAALYACFALGVVGTLGSATTTDAVSGLAAKYGTWIAIGGGIAGVLTTATSFIVLSLALKHALMYDLKVPRVWAAFLTLGAPLLLYCIATKNFVSVIGFIGAVLGGLEGLLMLRMHRASKAFGDRIPEYTVRFPVFAYYAIGLVFIAGIAYEIAYSLHF